MTAHILVVDDEPDLETLILQKFRHQIRDGKVSFSFARDGVEALTILEANDAIDLVVTDINMPRMDGLSLLQKLLENEGAVSTIVVSAYGDMSNIRAAMNRGAFDFVTKPIDFDDLETTIAKTIRHVEFLRDARQRQAVAERAFASLSRYFSPNLAKRLVNDADAVDLRGQRREIATIFTDIANFTELVETLEPNVLGELLNEYLSGMTEIVFSSRRHGRKDRRRCLAHPVRRPGRAARSCRRAPSPARWPRTSTPRNFANIFSKKASRWALRASVSMPDRRSSVILAADASSITPRTATPSMSRRGWKPPIRSLARAFVSAPPSWRRWTFSGPARGRSYITGQNRGVASV